MEELYGYIERITFQNPESGYTVAQLKQKGQNDLSCIVGTLSLVKPGETVRCQGQWIQHLIYGRQFVVASCHLEAPADVIGIRKYLGSGLVKGIGQKYANRIVDKFGKDTLHIIEKTPERLLEIEGLGNKRAGKIRECWEEQKSIRDVMIFLQANGVSPAYAQKVYKTYGVQSIKKVKENPFHLARDIHGIGFKKADAIAMEMGIPPDAPARIDAGIEYILTSARDDGHVCLPVEELVKLAQETLNSSAEAVLERLPILAQEGRVEIGDMFHDGKLQSFIWQKMLFLCEVGICRQMLRLRHATSRLRQVDAERAIDWMQKKLEIQLAENQQQAVELALKEKVQIITGGPGTGKSTITKGILAIMSQLTDKIVLAAPTGRAAKRMTEITGKKALTIHSLLEFNFKDGQFKRGINNPLECDLIIIDEASMIDTFLMYSLLKAIPDHARVVFVGDVNQLPSVGPGNVLKDIIASHCVPVTILNEIYRQAAGSRIITNAHRINQGVFPDISNEITSDFFFVDVETPEEVLQNILSLVAMRLPTKYKLDPFSDIQVLAPMKRGVIGIENLNLALQEKLNPSKEPPLLWSGRRFLPGDKVMQIRNDYERGVFNGDIGRIKHIDTAEQEVVVTIDDQDVVYTFPDLDDLVLAYAVSIHKYQGSECPCIVMPVHTTHFKLLHRNLLYTGVTRGKKLVILVGTKKALFIAVNNDEVRRRYTGLQQALAGAFSTSSTAQPL
ncbi:MAG: ATP-dependent RecD-like DNA helicase [Parachlamydiaceae bacterium]